MSKKFKFRYSSLLKLKEFEKEKLLVSLGRINQKLERIKESINDTKTDISNNYKLGSQGDDRKKIIILGYSSSQNTTLYNKIEGLNKEKDEVLSEYNKVIMKLSKSRGEVKLYKNLKDKEYAMFKKEELKSSEKLYMDISPSRKDYDES